MYSTITRVETPMGPGDKFEHTFQIVFTVSDKDKPNLDKENFENNLRLTIEAQALAYIKDIVHPDVSKFKEVVFG